MDFYLFLKYIGNIINKKMSKRLTGNTVKNFWIMLNNLLQMYLKYSFKQSNSKTAEVTGDLIGNKLVDKSTKTVLSKTKDTEIPKCIKI